MYAFPTHLDDESCSMYTEKVTFLLACISVAKVIDAFMAPSFVLWATISSISKSICRVGINPSLWTISSFSSGARKVKQSSCVCCWMRLPVMEWLKADTAAHIWLILQSCGTDNFKAQLWCYQDMLTRYQIFFIVCYCCLVLCDVANSLLIVCITACNILFILKEDLNMWK